MIFNLYYEVNLEIRSTSPENLGQNLSGSAGFNGCFFSSNFQSINRRH
jgi:hypothetical protein